MAATDPAPEGSELQDRNFFHISLVIMVGIFAVTMAQPVVLANLPIKNILKNSLHLNATAVSGFFLIVGLAWYLKPIAGVLTDAFPIFGTKRRHYILISTFMAAICWLIIAVFPPSYSFLLVGFVIVNVFMVMASTVVGAFLVEAGQMMGATGRLTSIRQTVFVGIGIITGVAGGKLAQMKGLFNTAVISAAIIFSLFPVTLKYLREKPVKADSSQAVGNAGRQVKELLTTPSLGWVMLLLALYYFAPGFATLLYFRQNDQLHFTQQYIGTLGSISAVGGVLAAASYGFAVRRFNVRGMIVWGIILNGAGTLLYLYYNSKGLAIAIDFQNAVTGAFVEVALLDLAARTIPVNCAGLGYAILLSIRNLCGSGADTLGSWLHDAHGWTFGEMVFLNAMATLLALVFLPKIPKALTLVKDRITEVAA